MIEAIQLKFGKSPGAQAEKIDITPVTVFVGPNNSGKSKVLGEIARFCSSGDKAITDVILDDITFKGVSGEEANAKIEKFRLKPHPNESLTVGQVIVGKRNHRATIPYDDLIMALEHPESHTRQYCQWYLGHQLLVLNGQQRIELVRPQQAGNLQAVPHTSLQVLFRDDSRREKVRRIVYDAFGQHLVIDPTNLGHLSLRLSTRAPTNSMEERGIHEEAVAFHAAAHPIDQASDGVKAFVGIVSEILAGDPEVLLVDEPEAFLHPSLAFNLGNEIARISQGSQKRLFVSTHSASFVMGCIQSGAPVNIVRLTYRDNIATARALPNEELLSLMRNPLLRSTGVISGLFYEFVVVTEADADRAFYQEVNERLLRLSPENGIANCLFLNAQNKQTIRTILSPLRKLGIPAAGIVDVDILKEGGTNWSCLLESLSIPELERSSLATLRASVHQKLEASGQDFKRNGGLSVLSGSDAEAANNLADRLANYGLFMLRNGELESWLTELSVTGHGPAWLIKIFEKMGEDPQAEGYVKPHSGDVWAFLTSLKVWLMSPTRKGIPN